MAVASRIPRLSVGFAPDGDGAEDLAISAIRSHSLVETSAGALGVVEQSVLIGWAEPLPAGVPGRLTLGDGESVTEVVGERIALAEHLAHRAVGRRLIVFGPPSESARAAAIADHWLAAFRERDALERLWDALQRERELAEATLREFQARPGA